MPNHDYSCDIIDPNKTSTKWMDLQVNLLRNNSTQVNKTMPFSYHKCTRVRVYNSSHIDHQAYKELIFKQFNHYIQYNNPKLHKNMSQKIIYNTIQQMFCMLIDKNIIVLKTKFFKIIVLNK